MPERAGAEARVVVDVATDGTRLGDQPVCLGVDVEQVVPDGGLRGQRGQGVGDESAGGFHGSQFVGRTQLDHRPSVVGR